MTPIKPLRAGRGRLVIAYLAVLILSAGCAGASLTPTPPSPPPATPAPTVTATPAAVPSATSSTGQMSHGRSFHTATALADGRVLVAGGYFDRYPIKLADVFDPASGTFASTGSLGAARGFDSATRLADGRVLFAGGDPSSWDADVLYLNSAELFDPRTGTFSPTGSMATTRDFHTATLLRDGRVLIVGGTDTYAHALTSAELYDPTSGTFSATGALGGPRGFHTATRLADGRVLIAGGTSDSWGGAKVLASAEIYNPNTGKFTATGAMSTKRASHTATLLADGRVLMVGGFGAGETSLASAEIYDPKTGKFTATGSMAEARTFQEASLLADGRVLVTGGDPAGWGYNGPFLDSAEIYDPTTGAFKTTGSMMDALTNHSATLLPDGRVLIAGGYDGSADVASAEIYDPTTGTFGLTGPGG
jgi:hypothetical protein